MARKGSNKKACDRYKSEGHLITNKKKREEKHQKRLRKFADKKASGKGYVYSKEKAAKKTEAEKNDRNKSLKTEPALLRSWFAKLDNEIKKEKEAEKHIAGKEKK